MALTKKLWSLNALETETGRDRRTIGKALAGVTADGKLGSRDAWHLSTVLVALARYDGPPSAGELDPAQERARKDRALAIQTEIKNDLAIKRVVLVDDVLRIVTAEYSIVKNRILSIPGTLASAVPPGVRDVVVEHATRVVHEALEELSEGKVVDTVTRDPAERMLPDAEETDGEETGADD